MYVVGVEDMRSVVGVGEVSLRLESILTIGIRRNINRAIIIIIIICEFNVTYVPWVYRLLQISKVNMYV